MNYSSLALKDSTHSRVNMLLDRDFQNFQNIKNHGLLEKMPKSWKFWSQKTLLYILAFIGIFLLPGNEISAQENNEQIFIATAYYSPLPNQKSYYRWSYEADIALNGNGTHGADGTKVFVGMVAAPKNIPFWTKIALDGLGVVSVHDRGGAITSRADGAIRIDIWMGYGDEWLARTKAWGRRTLTGKIVNKNTPVSFQLGKTQSKSLAEPTKTVNTQAIVLENLRKLGYKTEGKTFAENIIQFQIDQKIITSAEDYGAGYYGPKTSKALQEALAQKSTPQKQTKLEDIVVMKNSKSTPGNTSYYYKRLP